MASLPIEVPRSDTLFHFLTKGYSWTAVKAEIESDDESLAYRGRMLLERAQRAWDQIRQEVEISEPTIDQFERFLHDSMARLAADACKPSTPPSEAAELRAEHDRTLCTLLHLYQFLRPYRMGQK